MVYNGTPLLKWMIWGYIPLFPETSKSGDHHLVVGAKTYVNSNPLLVIAGVLIHQEYYNIPYLKLTKIAPENGWLKENPASFLPFACFFPADFHDYVSFFMEVFLAYFGTHFPRSHVTTQTQGRSDVGEKRGGSCWVGNTKFSSRLKIWNLISWS